MSKPTDSLNMAPLGQVLDETSLTETVIAATGPKATPRLKQIMPALIRHLHAFAKEVDLTLEEWFAGVDVINQCGQMSDDARNETQLLCDVLGLESLVDSITSKKEQAVRSSSDVLPPTPSTVLGPFYRVNAPLLPSSSSIVSEIKAKEYLPSTTYFSGRVLNTKGQPITGAVLDVWHTAPNGMYEQQDANQPEMDLRGRFQTEPDGTFSFYCLRPVPYPIPDDGPVGKLLTQLDRHPMRPAHVHFIITAPGFKTLTTQVFDSESPWLDNDTVFAVKKELVVKFEERKGDEKACWTVKFDFVLAPKKVAGYH